MPRVCSNRGGFSSFLHWEGVYLMSLGPGGFSNGGSHAVPAAPSAPQHPGLAPSRSRVSPRLHPPGPGKQGLGSSSGSPGGQPSSLGAAPTLLQQTPFGGGVAQAQVATELGCGCWGTAG